MDDDVEKAFKYMMIALVAEIGAAYRGSVRLDERHSRRCHHHVQIDGSVAGIQYCNELCQTH